MHAYTQTRGMCIPSIQLNIDTHTCMYDIVQRPAQTYLELLAMIGLINYKTHGI